MLTSTSSLRAIYLRSLFLRPSDRLWMTLCFFCCVVSCGHRQNRATRPSIDFCMPLKQQLLTNAGRLHRCSNSRPLIQHCASCSSPRVCILLSTSRRHDGDAGPKLLCFLLQLNNASQNSPPHQSPVLNTTTSRTSTSTALLVQSNHQSLIKSIKVQVQCSKPECKQSLPSSGSS